MSKPWLEDWEAQPSPNACDYLGRIMVGEDEYFFANDGGRANFMYPRIRLAAAAPALVRALLAVELKGDLGDYSPGCAACGGAPYGTQAEHQEGCPVDAALTAAGLPDQASRDEARKAIAERQQANPAAEHITRAIDADIERQRGDLDALGKGPLAPGSNRRGEF